MEKTLFDAYKEEVLADAASLGFGLSEIEGFELAVMPWSKFGECRKSVETGRYTICINEKDFMDERLTPKMRLRLLMHEVCHAQEGCLDHGRRWQEMAGLAEKAFPEKYGGIVENYEGADLQAALAKYLFRCPSCGHVYGTRSSRDRAMTGKALCIRCGAPFERVS